MTTKVYARPGGRPGALRLHLNEHTGGCSPAVLEALARLAATDVSTYPAYERVVDDCAAYLGVDPDELALTNGLDEGILIAVVLALKAARSAATEPPEAIVVQPTFEMCSIYVEALGGTIVNVPAGENFAFPLGEVLSAVTDRTAVVYLVHPNNPTGQLVPPDALRDLLAAVPERVTVFVDEAYYEFCGETFVPVARHTRNLVVGRTFAKAFGLAGLRAGCLVAHPDTLAPMRALLPPFNLNVCAVEGLRAALADRARLDWYLAEVRESKTLLYEFCRRHGLEFWPSGGNFVLVRAGAQAARLVAALDRADILVRDKSTDPACPGCIRITAGVGAHTRRALDVMEAAL